MTPLCLSATRPLQRVVSLVIVLTSAGLGSAWPHADRAVAEAPRANAGGLAGSGVAIAPRDAAFFSASLRLREQFDRIRGSNAFKALETLPAIKRGLDSLREQKDLPGSPLSLAETFMQLPENEQAIAVLRDMVATDTFVYGEPSCVTLLKLLMRLQRAQQAAALLSVPEPRNPDQQPLGNDSAALPASPGIVMAGSLRQQAEMEEELSAEERQTRAVVEALVDNLDLLVAPDLVWGFRVTDPEAARTQLKRLEVILKLLAQSAPQLADAIARKPLAGGELLTVTFEGELIPWDQLRQDLGGKLDGIEGLDEVFERLRSMDIVVALGVVGDRVILSIGDGIDHLAKIAFPAAGREGLLALPQFAALVEHGQKPLTGISYLSAALTAALAPTDEDLEPWLEAAAEAAERADLGEEGGDAARLWLGQAATAYAERLPEPGPWLAFSFLAADGYEGYVWDWARNLPFDGSRRLDVLGHAGGSPLAVYASRLKADPELFPEVVSLVRGGLDFIRDHVVPEADDDAQEKFEAFDEHVAPLGGRLAEIVETKVLPALADGQIGFVLDAKSRTKRVHESLPASAEPLPVPEAAIVLPLADAKLFREALSDLFALGDELVDALRAMDPEAVPDGYRIPDPRKSKVDAGMVWSFPLTRAGVDDQVAPAIGVGERAAVFALVPAQAARLLAASRLETAAALADFDRPLSSAAALDVAGIVDAIEPWVRYLTRYGSVQRRDSAVDRDEELSAADEDAAAKDVLANAAVVLDVLRTVRAAVAETSFRDDALVTHWRNRIKDLPAK